MNNSGPSQPFDDDGDDSRLHTVLDTAVDGIILIDARGTVLMFNKACEALFGYTAVEVIGHNVRMLMPAPYREEHDGYLESYKRTGEAKIIGIGREVTGQRKDGSTFPMDLSVGESKRQGESIFVGVIHDLSERKRSEEAERERVAQLRAVVDTAVDGVILIDEEGSIMMFNPACEKLFGYEASEVIGENVRVLMPEPYREEHDGYLENYKRTGEAKIIGIGREVTGQRKDGSTFPMDLSVGEARQNGKSTFVGIIHDLTERNRTQAQLIQAQKMETVGQLSGGIAHDFNNLLTVIIGNAEMLSESLKARPDLMSLADMIGAAGSRGADLTQRLLAFSRRQTLQPIEIDCNHFISSMQEMVKRTLREDIEVRTLLEEDLWPAFADAAQLESAILNLALNAQEAMPYGGCITIASANVPLDQHYRNLHPEVPPGRYVMVAVTDDGQGMPPDVLAKAFEPFFTTKEVGKGSGLGLSMVYGFVKQSNGHITIYSEPELGTTVRMYLPATDIESDAQALDATDALATDEAPSGNGTVLVVEDDPFVRAYAVASVEDLGYNVLAAVDGREALAQLAEDVEIDILFSDVVMPGGVNGLMLAKLAIELRPNLKVLLTSGYGLETLAARGHVTPGTVVLHKPYRRFELAQRLRELEARD